MIRFDVAKHLLHTFRRPQPYRQIVQPDYLPHHLAAGAVLAQPLADPNMDEIAIACPAVLTNLFAASVIGVGLQQIRPLRERAAAARIVVAEGFIANLDRIAVQALACQRINHLSWPAVTGLIFSQKIQG